MNTTTSAPTTPAPTFLTCKEVASALRVCLRTVSRMLSRNEFPNGVVARVSGRRCVRFNAAAFQKWVDAGCPAPAKSRR